MRSSFYYLSSNYDLSRVSSELKALASDGWDIGLHGDFGTHDSAQAMARAVAKFKEGTGIVPVGLREHYLRFDFQKTWAIAEGEGFRYDATVGNSDALGFRIGLCSPFHPPDGSWAPMKILELPLVLMDTTLWGYLKATEREGEAAFDSLLESVASVNGLFTLLWHAEAARMKGGRIYPRLLEKLAASGCFVGSGREIADWWEARRRAVVKAEGDGVTVSGAPEGLCLRFKAKEPDALSVDGGTVTKAEGGSVVHAKSSELRVGVS